MASSLDDSADSRTSGVGRKRALEHESPDITIIVDSDDEVFQSQKRFKASPSDTDDDPSFIEVGTQSPNLSANPAIEPQTSFVQQPASSLTDAAGLPSSTWNQAVQSGLRTSFGRKKITPLQDRQTSVELQKIAKPEAAEGDLSTGNAHSTVGVSTEHTTMNEKKSDAESDVDDVSADVEEDEDSPNASATNSDHSQKAPINAGNASSDGAKKKEMKMYTPYLRKLRAEVQNSNTPIPKKALQAEARALAAGRGEEAEQAIRSFVQRYQQQIGAAAEAKVSKKAAKKDLKAAFPNAYVPETAIPRTAEYDGLSEIIEGFRTRPGSSRQYKNRDGAYYLREIVADAHTEPIKLEQLSFRIFVPLFVWDNLETLCSNLNKLNVQMFSGAFSAYISAFYDRRRLALEEQTRAQGKNESARTLSYQMIATILEESHKAKGVPLRTPSLWEKLLQGIDKIQADSSAPAKVEVATVPRPKGSHGSAAPAREAILGPTGAQSEIVDDSSENEDLHEDQEMEIDAPDAQEITQEDIFLQEKYFPVPSGQEVLHLCMACAGTGHHADACPSMVCKKCCTREHPTLFCPQNKRCGKCRELGHERSECPEKLLAVRAEAVPCDLCKSVEHIESACPVLWRSFHLAGEVKKIHELQIHCFCCGGTGHYGLECGLHRGPVLSGDRTWSKKNWVQFIDFNSKERALSAGVDYSMKPKRGKGFNIKGMAHDPIDIDESDEETSSFIRPKINTAPARQGSIKFGGQTRNDSYAPRGQGYDGRKTASAATRLGNPLRVESARYGREREFSPPPKFREDRDYQPDYEADYDYHSTQNYAPPLNRPRLNGPSRNNNSPRQQSALNSFQPTSMPMSTSQPKNSNKRAPRAIKRDRDRVGARNNAPAFAPAPQAPVSGARKARSRKKRGGNDRGGMNGRN